MSSLTFTTATWDTPQTVSVTAIDDVIDRDDSVDLTVSVDTANSDVTYALVASETMTISLTNDDVASFTLDTTTLTIDENGGT